MLLKYVSREMFEIDIFLIEMNVLLIRSTVEEDGDFVPGIRPSSTVRLRSNQKKNKKLAKQILHESAEAISRIKQSYSQKHDDIDSTSDLACASVRSMTEANLLDLASKIKRGSITLAEIEDAVQVEMKRMKDISAKEATPNPTPETVILDTPPRAIGPTSEA